MAVYCTKENLFDSYGEENIQAWSRLNEDAITRAIEDAQAEIDGYLFSGGYTVPLNPPPKNIIRYCVVLAAANLLVGIGLLEEDTGGEGIIEKEKAARKYLEKVAAGKFKIPGYSKEGETSAPPPGKVRVDSMEKLDLGGY